MSRKVIATLLAAVLIAAIFSLSPSIGKAQAAIQDVEIDISQTANPNDEPVGITCEDPDFIWVTLLHQGAVVKVDRSTKQVVEIFNDPTGDIEVGQSFLSIVRDSSTGNLFVNEDGAGIVWKFNPDTEAWQKTIIVENLDDPDDTKIIYPSGFENNPTLVKFVTSNGDYGYSFGTGGPAKMLFAAGYVWHPLSYKVDFHADVNNEVREDLAFSGLARIDPDSMEVTRYSIAGAQKPVAVQSDPTDADRLWILDQGPDAKLLQFDISTQSVTKTIDLPDDTNPRNFALDSTHFYVPLSIAGDGTENNKILQVSRASPGNQVELDTGAKNFEEGVYSVFLTPEGQVKWTDLDGFIGTYSLDSKSALFEKAVFADSNHYGCDVDGQFYFAGKGSAHVGIADTEATAFTLDVAGKVKKVEGTTTRDVTVKIEGDYSCDANMRVKPVAGSMSATLTMTGNNGGSKTVTKVTFQQVDDFAFKYNVNAGSWGKLSGKTTFGSVQDCHNDVDLFKTTKKNTMTLTKTESGTAVKYKVINTSDLGKITYLE